MKMIYNSKPPHMVNTDTSTDKLITIKQQCVFLKQDICTALFKTLLPAASEIHNFSLKFPLLPLCNFLIDRTLYCFFFLIYNKNEMIF